MDVSRDERVRRALWIVVVLLAAVFVSLNAYRLLAGRHADPDQFWHVETGRWVVQHRAVPLTDPFSWYGRERSARWIAHEWLWGVLSYLVYAMGGWRWVYAFTGLLDGALFLLAYMLARIRSGRQSLSLVIASLVVIGTLPNLAPRPQMLTFCFLLVIAILGEKGKLWWALPIVLLGANVHGGAYPIYLIVLAFYAIPAQPLVLAAAAPLVLLNPNGAGLLTYALGVANPDASFINEFQPTALVSRPLDFAVYMGTVVILWGQKIKVKDAILAIALVVLSLSAVRQVAFFYVLVLPILSPYFPSRLDLAGMAGTADGAAGARASDSAPLSPAGAASPEPVFASAEAPMGSDGGLMPMPDASGAATAVVPFERWTPTVGGLALFDLAPALMMAMFVALTAGAAIGSPLHVADGYPEQAARYIRQHHITRLFNVWGDGGYLIHAGVPPLIDGRGDPFMAPANHGVDMAHDYLTTLSVQREPRRFLNDYGIRYLLLHRGMPYYRTLMHDSRISVVYEDADYVVLRYQRPKPKGPVSGSGAPKAPANRR